MSNVQAPIKGGVVVPHKPSRKQRIGAWLVFALIRTVSLTLRYRWVDRSGLNIGHGKPVIFAFWHNRLALCTFAYFKFVQKRTLAPGVVALISASRDGGFLSAIFEWFKIKAARGSSSRRGPQALRELTTFAKKGYDIGLTPDGPRGPRYEAHDGVIYLAQLTGQPILPFTFNLQWKIRAKSWDQFQIPLPFSRCEMIFEKLIPVPRELTSEQREAIRKQLEETLKSISLD